MELDASKKGKDSPKARNTQGRKEKKIQMYTGEILQEQRHVQAP